MLILYQAFMSRLAGGGIWPKRPANLAEVLFSLPFGLAYHHPVIQTFACLWAFAWMTTGHAVAFHMGSGENFALEGRKAPLSRVVDPLCHAARQPLGGSFYCWAFMGLKGFLIHLPLGLYALPMAFLWPLSYFIGNVLCPKIFPETDGEMIAECLAGAFSGLVVSMAI